jgi:hypothetical protein
MKIALRVARAIALLAALAAASAFNAARANHYILPCPPDCRDIAIGPGMTGSWFDGGQSGHGLSIEVLPGQPLQLRASWFVFAPDGGQSWIIGQGPVAGTRAVLQGYQMVGPGGRFPPAFDQARVRAEPWGTLTFTFRDCNHGQVAWASSAPGYGNGIMELERLTLPAGLTCGEDAPSTVSETSDIPR